MEKSFSESYKAAGVDITAGSAAVELMKQHVARTMTPVSYTHLPVRQNAPAGGKRVKRCRKQAAFCHNPSEAGCPWQKKFRRNF